MKFLSKHLNIPFPHLKKSKIFHSQSPNIITSMILVKCIIQIPNKKSMFMPLQFGVNVYFGQPKSNLNPHPNYVRHAPMPEFYNQNNQEQIPICILFKNSLAKSGYKLTPEQSVLYRDTYKKHSSVNSFYDSFNYFPINNNHNIINNIYPTFTKVTNVQILSENEKLENKGERK